MARLKILKIVEQRHKGLAFAHIGLHLQNLGAHLVTALAHLHVRNSARRDGLEAESSGRKGGTETLPQQVIKNSGAVQQEKISTRLHLDCSKLILVAM
jgi:hypothetical protein